MVSHMIQNKLEKTGLLGRPARKLLAVQRLTALALPLLVSLTGCLSPVAMHRAVLEYDRTVSRVDAEMLVLNIARARHHHPLHFTAVSSVAATFDFRAKTGINAQLFKGVFPGPEPGFTKNFYMFDVGAEMAENPTVVIVPIQGEEFAKRILAPLDETKFGFLFQRGVDPAILLRLMARGIAVDDRPGSDVPIVLLNSPTRTEEYQEFRRIAQHLSAINLGSNLYVQALSYEEVWPLPLDHPVTAQALEKGFQWSQPRKGEPPLLTKKVIGRLAITNYNPVVLSDEERRRLHEEAERFPRDRVLVDLRPEYAGGNFTFHGRVLLRSFEAILAFLAHGIDEEPEFDVEPDARSGLVPKNPAMTIEILETASPPPDAAFSVQYAGKWYSIRSADERAVPDRTHDERESHQKNLHAALLHAWSLDAFRALYQLFQLTVTDVGKVPTLPITIAK